MLISNIDLDRQVSFAGHKSKVACHRSQVTGHRSQVTGHRSQVTPGTRKICQNALHLNSFFAN